MEMSDLNRLNNHMGMLSDSIKPVDTSREVDEALRRWPTLATAYEMMSVSRSRKHDLSQEQALSGLNKDESYDLRELPAS